jgi:hypothetical protein
MATDIRTFTLALDKVIENIPIDANMFKRHVALDLLTRVVEKTPVDTGRARANWQVSVSSPSAQEIQYRSTEPIAAQMNESSIAGATIEKGSKVIDTVEIGEDIWLHNNLPYIEVLENGRVGNKGSEQAPNGMVALSVAEVEEGFTRI